MGASPLQNFIAALRQLFYGVRADMMDKYCLISEITALKSMKEFFAAVVDAIGVDFLQR